MDTAHALREKCVKTQHKALVFAVVLVQNVFILADPIHFICSPTFRLFSM